MLKIHDCIDLDNNICFTEKKNVDVYFSILIFIEKSL